MIARLAMPTQGYNFCARTCSASIEAINFEKDLSGGTYCPAGAIYVNSSLLIISII